MIQVQDIEPNVFIPAVAERLETEVADLEMPEWAQYVKTGSHKERRPQQDNWWYLRSAAILRRIHLDGPLGVRKLKTFYGGRKKRGHAPEKHYGASGKVIRTMLQQLEEANLVKTEESKGRAITDEGKRFLDAIAREHDSGA